MDRYILISHTTKIKSKLLIFLNAGNHQNSFKSILMALNCKIMRGY